MKNFLKWALIIGMINIVLGIVGYLIGGIDTTGQRDTASQIIGWIGPVAGIVCLYLGVKQKKDMDPADYTFGRGWVEGFLISLVSSVIISLWVFVLFSAIAPELVDTIRETSLAEMAKTQPAEAVEQARGYMDFMISPTGFFLFTFLGFTFGGMILSLIVSAIVGATGGGSKNSGEPANA